MSDDQSKIQKLIESRDHWKREYEELISAILLSDPAKCPHCGKSITDHVDS
jgi:hypothetical protein